MVFADVDNTLLCLKMKDYNGKRTVGFSEYNDWLKYNILTNAYINCSAPKGMYNLIEALHNNGAKVYGLTECSNSFEYNRLRECYEGIFEHHGDLISIDSRNKKVLIMQLIAEKEGLDLKDTTIQESINGIKKKYINEINEFHQSNLMLMQQTNENNKKNLEELKMRKREHKEQLKQKKKLSEKKAPKGKNIKQESKSKFNYKIMIIAFILLSSITLFRYGIKYYIQHNEY